MLWGQGEPKNSQCGVPQLQRLPAARTAGVRPREPPPGRGLGGTGSGGFLRGRGGRGAGARGCWECRSYTEGEGAGCWDGAGGGRLETCRGRRGGGGRRGLRVLGLSQGPACAPLRGILQPRPPGGGDRAGDGRADPAGTEGGVPAPGPPRRRRPLPRVARRLPCTSRDRRGRAPFTPLLTRRGRGYTSPLDFLKNLRFPEEAAWRRPAGPSVAVCAPDF